MWIESLTSPFPREMAMENRSRGRPIPCLAGVLPKPMHQASPYVDAKVASFETGAGTKVTLDCRHFFPHRHQVGMNSQGELGRWEGGVAPRQEVLANLRNKALSTVAAA